MLKPHIRLFDLKLQSPWSIASRLGSEGKGIATQSVCLLKLIDEQGNIGYGEASPVARYNESIITVFNFISQTDWGNLSFDNLGKSLSYLHRRKGNFAAKAAIDGALHDGAAKKRKIPLHTLLGLKFDPIANPPSSYSIGLGSPETIKEKALAAHSYPILKLKAGPTALKESVAAIRSVSPEKTIRVDGNEAWATPEIALRNIEILYNDGYTEFVEQPMPQGTKPEDLAWLKERSPLPLIADESYHNEKDIDHCAIGFHGVNVKLTKTGGVANALNALQAASTAGLDCQIGCMIESSLGIATAFHLSSQARWLDLDGALLTQNDPFQGIIERNGHLSFRQSSEQLGAGVTPMNDIWNLSTPQEKPISRRSTVTFPEHTYGYSRKKTPLTVYLPQSGETDILIFASIHGEETETTALLSKALRSLETAPPRTAVVLCANPDGALLGTRCNAAGVELNRNFPSSNWQSEPVSTKWAPNHGRVEYSTGSEPASEPENQALIRLIENLAPKSIIALHAPLACIDDPQLSDLGKWLADATDLPLIEDIGYPTPGSFGSWAKENGWHAITYELPPQSVSALHEKHIPTFIRLLQNGLTALNISKLGKR
ncbi:murein tripeptide amidase MpaA [Puniceicoccaceae bacterium K14]|nr:murein tripeptide amidase MpaA [Puniceicoccaceae bacterium K14]